METYRVIGMGADPDVGDRTNPALFHDRIFVGGAATVFGKVDGAGNAIDESDHGVLPIADMITKSDTEDA